MSENGWDHLPKPDAIWVALGIVTVAIATALGARRRADFVTALRTLADRHDARERIIAFGRQTNGRTMSRAVQGGVAWVRRLIVELDDGAGR